MLLQLIVSTVIAATPQTPSAPPAALQRYAFVVGANFGGADRPKLQYAVSDAERFARVMSELGGVSSSNAIILRQPKIREFLDGLDALSARVAAVRKAAPGTRTEIVMYYSGHADEKGLLLGEDRVSYRSLRDKLDEIPADVRIAVLDACASGAFTRLKGGVTRPPFLIDESTAMRGHAFLTSSAETEAAQESDRIGASYFTHYLVSGFRGAADSSGDGRVTLNEAYQFAFTETLGHTVDTKGGAQHPSYDINLSGTGDVVMTDVRQTSARLVLSEDIDGRFFIRTGARELVVELYKPAGRAVELGLEPGTYDVRVERERQSLSTRVRIAEGGRHVLDARQLSVAPVEATRRRGDANRYEYTPPPFQMNGRQRVSGDAGMWGNRGMSVSPTLIASDSTGGIQYAIFAHENLAVTVGISGFSGYITSATISGTGAAVPIGVEWNPIPGRWAERRIKPWVTFGAMPVTASVIKPAEVRTDFSFGVYAGAGFDLHLLRWLSIGARGQYNVVPDSASWKGRDTYGGRLFAMRGSVIFGKTR